MENFDIADIIALIVAIGTIYKVTRMMPKEVKQVDAEAADKYATAASKVAEQNTQLHTEIELLEKKWNEKFATLEQQIETLKKKLSRRDALLREWQLGIDKLLDQICRANGTPEWRPTTNIDDLDDET